MCVVHETENHPISDGVVKLDFGSNYVGYLYLKVRGTEGQTVIIKCGQELNKDGSVRYDLRANCVYEERWVLSEGECILDRFDYKAFRYAEIIMLEICELKEVCMCARHYPFTLKTDIKEKYLNNQKLKSSGELSQRIRKRLTFAKS